MLDFENIKLRPIKECDLEFLNKWKNEYEIFKYLGGGYNPQSIDEQKLYINKIIDSSVDKRFIIEVLGEPIGMIGLYSINYRDRNCNIGVYIGNEEYWGKGFANKSVGIMVNYAFNNLNLMKIKLLVVEENLPAVQLYKKVGFKEVGIFKNDRFINGKYRNVIAMEMIREGKI